MLKDGTWETSDYLRAFKSRRRKRILIEARKWVIQGPDLSLPVFDLDFVNNRAWMNGRLWKATDVIPTADLEETGLRVGASDSYEIELTRMPFYSAAEGTVIIEATAHSAHAANYALWGIDLDANTRFIHYRNASMKLLFVAVNNSVVSMSDTGTVDVEDDAEFKTACAWKVNDCAWSQNGATVRTDTSVTIPVGMTTFTIGKDHTSAQWLGTIQRITYFNKRFANAYLESISA